MIDDDALAAVIAAANAILSRRTDQRVPLVSRWLSADRLGDDHAQMPPAAAGSRWAQAGRIV